MVKQETVEKVVELVQSDERAKSFRPDYPVSENLRQLMVSEVFKDYMIYVLDQYYDDANLSLLKEYVDDHDLSPEKQQGLLYNLFWWKLLYESTQTITGSSIEAYISENFHSLRKKPLISSWLRECGKAISKFYYVGYKYNDRVLVVIDMLTDTPLDVIVYDPTAIPPKKGEIVMGTLMPLGGGLYFPITDFYHFDFEAREAIANCLHHYYDKHLKNSTMHEAFIHVLSAMLQIEKIIFKENQEKISSK